MFLPFGRELLLVPVGYFNNFHFPPLKPGCGETILMPFEEVWSTIAVSFGSEGGANQAPCSKYINTYPDKYGGNGFLVDIVVANCGWAHHFMGRGKTKKK